MAQVASGHVRDRPFVRTLYTIASKRFSGDLTLSEGGRSYAVRWAGGAIVAAKSPAPADTVARIALAAGLVNTTQVSETLRRLANDKTRSVLAVLAEVAKLKPKQVESLRQRHFVRRAIRIFALSDATLSLDNESQLEVEDGTRPLDVRWLIYRGLATHYDERRLNQELAVMGDRQFQLSEDARPALAAFGFDKPETATLAKLSSPTNLPEFLHEATSIDRRRAVAIVYALVATDCVRAVAADAARPTPVESAPPGATPRARPVAPDETGELEQDTIDDEPAQILSLPPPAAPPQASTATLPPTPTKRALGAVKKRRASGPQITPEQASQLVATKQEQLDANCNLFQLFDISNDSTAEEIRLSYFRLARYLHPDRLRALGLDELESQAQRVFAEINRGFDTLNNPSKRQRYLATLAAGGEQALQAQQDEAEELAAKLFGAEQAFQLGTMALRRNQFREAFKQFQRAVDLNPDEAEHHAMLAWSMWSASTDKKSVGKEVRRGFRRAISLQPKSVPAYYYRGKIANAEGQHETALECFHKVLELEPTHKGASTELRVMEARKQKDKTGLFGRRKR